MATEFSLSPPGERLPLQPDAPLASLNLPVSTKETLRKLGITKLNELASTTPVQLQWQGLGPMELRQVSAVLEEFFLSLDRSDLLRVYSSSVEAWGPFLSSAEVVRQAVISRWLLKTSIDRLFPKDGERIPPGLGIPVGDLNISVRTYNWLKISRIANVHELALASPPLLRGVRNLGCATLAELANVLEEYFFSLEPGQMATYDESYKLWMPLFVGRPHPPRGVYIRPPKPDPSPVSEMSLPKPDPSPNIERLFPKGDEPKPPGLMMPIGILSISVRAFNCLKFAGIANVHELALASPAKLRGVRNLGHATLIEFVGVLEEYFSSLVSSEMVVYKESYKRWKPRIAGRPHSPLGFYIRPPKPAPSPVMEDGSPKPDPTPVTEKDPPDPAVYGDPPRPPGLDVPVCDLLLPARVLNCLESWGLGNLHEMALIEPPRFLKAYYFGRRSLDAVARVLKEYFDSLEQLGHWQVYELSSLAWKRHFPDRSASSDPKPKLALPPSPPPSIAELIWAFLDQLNVRDRSILVKRFALTPGSSPQTLESIGQSWGVSRESIRQLARKLQRKIAATVRRHHPGLVPQLRTHLDKVVVATSDELFSLVPTSGESTECDFGNCIRMLLTAPPGAHTIDPAGRLWTLLPSIDSTFYRKVQRAAVRVGSRLGADLTNLAQETARHLKYSGPEIDAVRVIFLHSPPAITIRRPSIQRAVPRDPKAASRRRAAVRPKVLSPRIPSFQSRRRDFIYAYLRKRGKPATIIEIFDAMEEMEPIILPHRQTRHLAIHSLRFLLEHDDRFAWAGASAFGLREWGYEPGVTTLAQATFALLSKAGPLTLPRIQKTLGKLYQVNPNLIALTLNDEKGKTVTQDSHGRWQSLC